MEVEVQQSGKSQSVVELVRTQKLEVVNDGLNASREDPGLKRKREGEEAEVDYFELQKKVQKVLQTSDDSLGASQKISLTMEVLRARQLEIELEKSKQCIQSIVERTKDSEAGSRAKTLRAAVSTSAVKDVPLGTFVDIKKGMFRLESASNDSDVLYMTLIYEE